MATEREIQETVARCVSIMVFYKNGEKTTQATEMMVAEVHAVAGWVRELGLGVGETDARILRAAERELLARYGHEVTPRLYAALLDAFEGPGAAAPATGGGRTSPATVGRSVRHGRAVS